MSPIARSLSIRRVAFPAVAIALLGALSWISWSALALERDRNDLRAYWSEQDAMRLALWQLDASVAALLAGEAARPYYHYDALYEERYAMVRQPAAAGEEGELVAAPVVRVPSPLLQARQASLEPFFQLHFQLSPEGELSSPQAPLGEARRRVLAEGWRGEEALDRYDQKLRQLSQALSYRGLLREFHQQAAERSEANLASPAPGVRTPWERERQRTIQQFGLRSQSVVLANGRTQSVQLNRGIGAEAEAVSQSGFVPLPVRLPGSGARELLFVRSVTIEGRIWLQGLWANWRELRADLLAQVQAVYPEGEVDLVPLDALPDMRRERIPTGRLASVPALIALRRSEPLPPLGWTETRTTLALAWGVALAGLTGLGLALRAAHELSERRGRFVSSVTHELRTPLTTFCMYSEMLAQGIVSDPQARQEYYETLQSEAHRLRGIVENVLAFARVEGGRGAPSIESCALDDLLRRSQGELERRAADAGLELEVSDPHGLGPESVRAVPQSVAQILFNLVDNAAKYAPQSGQLRLELDRAPRSNDLVLRLIDRGPGIPSTLRQSVFDAFERGTAASDNDRPGLGLGLPLCRALAQQMGGRLLLASSSDQGSAFELHLARA